MGERFIHVFIASLLSEQGVNEPLLVARRVVEDMDRLEMLNRSKVLAAQIKIDPCRDWRVIQRKTGASRSFIYKVWGQ